MQIEKKLINLTIKYKEVTKKTQSFKLIDQEEKLNQSLTTSSSHGLYITIQNYLVPLGFISGQVHI